MPSFADAKILKHSAGDIYKMVIDIESYPKFLPWCEAAKIISINSK